MNKKDIISELERFPFDRNEYWLITGSAMVLYGIREQTHDIDMGCTEKMADLLEKEGYLCKITSEGRRYFKYGELIEIFEGWICDHADEVEGYQVISIRGLIEMKRSLGREKDIRDIKLIEEHLKDVKSENGE